MSRFLQVVKPTPILSTPHFSLVFNGKESKLLTDENGHIRAIEFIALENSSFKIEEEKFALSEFIYKVSTPFYPKKELFIDSRFTMEIDATTENAKSFYLTIDQISEKLKNLIGTKYLWGGNWSLGIPELLEYYTPINTLPNEQKDLWLLKGVDCSGLLYEVTDGFTPRNTSELLNFGSEIKFSGLSDIEKMIRPLDLLVYRGHVVIYFGDGKVIESREKEGVTVSSLQERLVKFPKNFSLRRWIE